MLIYTATTHMNTKLILLYRALDVMVSRMSPKVQWSVTEREFMDDLW